MSNRRQAVKDQSCPNCGQMFSAQGITGHISSCSKRLRTSKHQETFKDLAERLSKQEASQYQELLGAGNSSLNQLSSGIASMGSGDIDVEQSHTSENNDIHQSIPQQQTSLLDTLDALDAAPQEPPMNDDKIRIEFHPSSGKHPKHFGTSHYDPYSTRSSKLPKPPDNKPWHPFRSRLDFEIAELVLDTHMNSQQTQTLLSLIKRSIEDPQSFTIDSATELGKTWELARTYRAAGFVQKEYLAPFRDEEVQYEIYLRPLLDWCTELLRDPYILPKFRWHAERHYKESRAKEERLFGEPWTANDWWKIQDSLPNGALPFCIIIYADKTRLSTFGTAKAYPVLARCANLPSNIRNGSDVGGGRLVGWLPIVEEDASETGNKDYVNFKRVVWHKGFYEILLSIQKYATTGYHTKCADNIIRWLFFFILIISADYEEQCVIALTRGTTSKFPCPVCLVPKDELSNLAATYPYRTTHEIKKVFEDAQTLNAKDRENLLKNYGLRNIENVFWMMNGTDVYSALSWDRLHAYHGGLFSDHLWSEFKDVLDVLGKKDAGMVDDQVDRIPRYPNLYHFRSIVKTGEFADGTKYEDMAKIIVFASHNVLQSSERGYCLLRLMRCFLELDMYSSLTIQSETTLAGLEQELQVFGSILEEYMAIHPDKNWNFPKNHSHIHMILDILAKGVTRNFNTKPNEKAHGLLKLWYRFHTNFKNIAPQILKLNENDLISMIIRMGIDALDEYAISQEESQSDSLDTVPNLSGEPHIAIGSFLEPISFTAFETAHEADSAFSRFRIKVGKYLASVLNKPVRLIKDHMIRPLQLARVHYQSVIDWSPQRDLVRVSPSFFGRPRNDFVFVKANNGGHFFAQLLTMFTVSLEETTHQLALILPFDGALDRRTTLARKRDRDLRFLRVQARRRTNTAIINMQCVVRGGLLVEDYGNDSNDFIIIDVVDPDMWWRLKSVVLSTNVSL